MKLPPSTCTEPTFHHVVVQGQHHNVDTTDQRLLSTNQAPAQHLSVVWAQPGTPSATHYIQGLPDVAALFFCQQRSSFQVHTQHLPITCVVVVQDYGC